MDNSSGIKDYEALAYCANCIASSCNNLKDCHGKVDLALKVLDSWESTGATAFKTKLEEYSSTNSASVGYYEAVIAKVGKIAKSISNYTELDETLKNKLNGDDFLTGLGEICQNVTEDSYKTYINSLGVTINGVHYNLGELSGYQTYKDENGNVIEYAVYVPKNLSSINSSSVTFYLTGAGHANDPINSATATKLTSGEYDSNQIVVFIKNPDNYWKGTAFTKNKNNITNNFLVQVASDLNVSNIEITGHSSGCNGTALTVNHLDLSSLKEKGINLSKVTLISNDFEVPSSETLSELKENGTEVTYTRTVYEGDNNGKSGKTVLQAIYGDDWESHYTEYTKTSDGTHIQHGDTEVVYETSENGFLIKNA